MFDPVSTYRIQFHKDFTFSDLEKVIPYLSALGIKTIYASPIFEAVPGSLHGYDVTNPLVINPEIGTLSQLRSISKKLKRLNMGWLQDIVPNHMAFHPDNDWLMDVLEKGRDSGYAGIFDILWDNPDQDGKLMVPFLGKPLDEVLLDNELKLVRQGKPVLDYLGQRYPLRNAAYPNDASLKSILDQQYYRLCYWGQTDKQINYRRFFTVNGLICLNMQDEAVFNQYHQLIQKLVGEGVFQGLRVDHIDGLQDPGTYLERLRVLAGEDTYIIVEKILEDGEKFPAGWPVQGNTGYDFLATVNNLFTNHKSKKIFSGFYKDIDPEHKPVKKSIPDKKRWILENQMAGELENLYRLFVDLKLADEGEIGSIGPGIFKKAIAEILVYCPVYRYYGQGMPLDEDQAGAIHHLLTRIIEEQPGLNAPIAILENCLLYKPKFENPDYLRRALQFYQRLMQFTGPLMAKGVEDTLMYSYNRFIDHNEVGDSPASFGLKIQDFHKTMQERQQQWPVSMNATATHDTKRGEDVRARLNVLSDTADEWLRQVNEWYLMNAKLKTAGFPDSNDEYFIYQTLAGASPMPGQDEDNFVTRIRDYLVKALREAKRNSNWNAPDEIYEQATMKFASALLDKKENFWKSFEKFNKKLADFGIINSLSQVLLKYTCPGLPDLYQGCALWDLSLVDPDNRRPVAYDKRKAYLSQTGVDWTQLWETRYDGRIKLTLLSILLKQRAEMRVLFRDGEYVPLNVKGKYKENIVAFARRLAADWLVVAIPLHLAVICPEGLDSKQFDWEDTRIMLPDGAPLSWKNLLSISGGYSANAIAVKDIFSALPLALLQLAPPKHDRSAGVLMHITSLPSAFGIGDLGPEAYRFADFLFRSRQKYWQLLPVGPVDKGGGYSPYSSPASMAGNSLLISPELLVQMDLLGIDDLDVYRQSDCLKVDYDMAGQIKHALLEKAYYNFLNTGEKQLHNVFNTFKNDEAYWLDDYALYEVLKQHYGGKPWYQWPKPYKSRDSKALKQSSVDYEEALDQVKWFQFLFASQWEKLKAYCHAKGIKLLGDMPFYASYDSVDVWANPELFRLDAKGNMTGIAGVPPDYFSAEGQLWGMPVYNWDTLKENKYDWWISRIKKSLQYFDLIRLDHFRAFSAYWEVPGGNRNAIHGHWRTGPGADLFEHLKKEIGCLPFVAEDLGEINDEVYDLRDQFNLPGMRVIQFAFDEAMPVSEHIPHNYTVNSFAYTGTHDNDTITGWYRNGIDDRTKERLQKYLDKKKASKNVYRALIRAIYASVAKTAMIPMQDILGLDSGSRMNIPSSSRDNWTWRLSKDALSDNQIKYLEKLAAQYNRA